MDWEKCSERADLNYSGTRSWSNSQEYENRQERVMTAGADRPPAFETKSSNQIVEKYFHFYINDNNIELFVNFAYTVRE